MKRQLTLSLAMSSSLVMLDNSWKLETTIKNAKTLNPVKKNQIINIAWWYAKYKSLTIDENKIEIVRITMNKPIARNQCLNFTSCSFFRAAIRIIDVTIRYTADENNNTDMAISVRRTAVVSDDHLVMIEMWLTILRGDTRMARGVIRIRKKEEKNVSVTIIQLSFISKYIVLNVFWDTRHH